MIDWYETRIPLDALKDYPTNPRRISKAAFQQLVNSLKEDGYHQRLIVSQDNVILSGHMRKKALLQAGYKRESSIPCLNPHQDLTPEQQKRILLRSNGEYGEFDLDIVANDFDIPSLESLAFPPNLLEDLLSVPEESIMDLDKI